MEKIRGKLFSDQISKYSGERHFGELNRKELGDVGKIIAECTIDQHRIAVIDAHSTAGIVRGLTVGVPGGDSKTVQHCCDRGKIQ